jgi:predicted DNA-binding transcriptional regulator AlpA
MTEQFLNYKQVSAKVGLARSTLTRMVRLGTFPRPIKLGYATRFLATEVDAWMQRCLDRRHVPNI